MVVGARRPGIAREAVRGMDRVEVFDLDPDDLASVRHVGGSGETVGEVTIAGSVGVHWPCLGPAFGSGMPANASTHARRGT